MIWLVAFAPFFFALATGFLLGGIVTFWLMVSGRITYEVKHDRIISPGSE